MVVTPIVSLFFSGSPGAVFWTIVSVIVFALYCVVLSRFGAHSGEEFFERGKEEFNPPFPVVFIRRVFGVGTSAFSTAIRLVFCGMLLTGRCPMCCNSRAKLTSTLATARFSSSYQQGAFSRFSYISTSTFAVPMLGPVKRPSIPKNYKEGKTTTSKILKPTIGRMFSKFYNGFSQLKTV